jgi:RNA polymerase sigma factor (TIGR02999 family)
MPHDSALPGEITALLTRWSEGDRAALTSLASLAYDDLRVIATGFLQREGYDHTLQATALVNELYLRLVRQRGVHFADRTHFYTLSAIMMRRILSDYARQSHAQKRPGGQQIRIPLHEDLAWVDASSDEMLALDRALDELEALDERAVRIVDLRFFLGCTNEETAGLLGISRATVDRDLEFAKTWLYRRLSSGAPPANPIPPGGLS